MNARVQAVVPDTHTASAVAGLRGLGRAGIEVTALGSDRRTAGLWSRYAAHRAVAPDAEADPHAFVEAVARLAAERGPIVVYPAREETIDALVDESLGMPRGAILPFPIGDALDRVRDKRRLLEVAEVAGIGVPAMLTEGTASAVLRDPPPTPCVVKPTRPGRALRGALPSARVVYSQAGLHRLVSALPGDERLLLQERCIGPLLMVSLVLARDGSVTARFQQVARETWPRDAGTTSRAVSLAVDESLAGRAAEMLAGIGFFGLAQLDFISTERGPRLIDVNPRFYTSLPLALACGVNLAAAWHAAVTDTPVEVSRGPYPTGVAYRWLEADLTAALRGSPLALRCPLPKPRAGAMWAGDDPLAAALLAAGAAAARLRRRLPEGRLDRRGAARRAATDPAPDEAAPGSSGAADTVAPARTGTKPAQGAGGDVYAGGPPGPDELAGRRIRRLRSRARRPGS